MRLICPKCEAQYEIPAGVIPPEGRDVQCSNCDHFWFQELPEATPVRRAVAQPRSRAAQAAGPAGREAAPEAAGSGSRDAESTDTGGGDPEGMEPDAEAASGPEHEEHPEAPEAGTPAAMPGRRALDPAVADVLRAEAELEARARRMEVIGMESQPELGLPEGSTNASSRAREARERMAKLRSVSRDEQDESELLPGTAAATAVATGRRDLLPDIEQINSTLRSNDERPAGADPGQTARAQERERRSGRLGFSLALASVAVALLVYVFATRIGEAVPQAGPALAAYVDMVDGWRVWLDMQLAAALTWLDAQTSAEGG